MAANNKSNFLSEAILEESLVDLWPDYPCLYDVRSPEFKDRVKRDSAIHEIAEKLEQEGECPPDNPIHFTKQILSKFVFWFSLRCLLNHTSAQPQRKGENSWHETGSISFYQSPYFY